MHLVLQNDLELLSCWERWDKLGTLHSPDVRCGTSRSLRTSSRGGMINEAVGMNSRELIVVLEVLANPVGCSLKIDNFSVFESHNFKAREGQGQRR